VALNDKQRAFIAQQRGAAMITLGADGAPHAVRVGVALVDGTLWSSGTQGRARTRHLRRDPRCTLFFWEAGYGYLSLATRVHILEGPDVPQQSVRLFQTMQSHLQNAPGTLTWNGQPLAIDDFLKAMVDEQRLIYEFDVERSYGMI
jgi:PPOX class probable F420-dependent enzyme